MNKKALIFSIVFLVVLGAGGVLYTLCGNKSMQVAVVEDQNDIPNATVNNSVYSVQPSNSNKILFTSLPSSTPLAERLKIVAVGDILLGRGVESRLVKANKDYIYPFLEVADIMKKGDVVFGNLEEAITSRNHSLTGIKQGGKYVLKNPVDSIKGLEYAGFNLFSLANNHILDYYEEGLYDTQAILTEYGMAYSGAGKNIEEAKKPAIIEKKGIKIGLLSYTDMAEVTYKGNPPLMFIAGENKAGVAKRPLKFDDSIKNDIDKLRKEVDILMVSLHWGNEEHFEIWNTQIEFAHNLMDNGVDVILGHHPHQFQGIEIYKGKPIFYSLGNFIFDQNDPENQESFIMNMEFINNKMVSLEGIPVRTIDKTQVVPQKGEGAKNILEREIELCKKLNTKCEIKEDKLIFDLTSN
jgi:poly-gamma-glutamate capsule biosynthesis protein CapA/YwtB (metallophosphatase superfamily)